MAIDTLAYIHTLRRIHRIFYTRATKENIGHIDTSFLNFQKDLIRGDIDHKMCENILSDLKWVDSIIALETDRANKVQKDPMLVYLGTIEHKMQNHEEESRQSFKKVMIGIGIPVVFGISVAASITATWLTPWANGIKDGMSDWFHNHFAVENSAPVFKKPKVPQYKIEPTTPKAALTSP